VLFENGVDVKMVRIYCFHLKQLSTLTRNVSWLLGVLTSMLTACEAAVSGVIEFATEDNCADGVNKYFDGVGTGDIGLGVNWGCAVETGVVVVGDKV
jgi:hypothetical protein